MIKKVCPICGKEFIAKSKTQKFCSTKCSCISKRVPKRICPQCGKEYKYVNKHQVYCSHKCYEEAARLKNVQTCDYCGNEFYKPKSQIKNNKKVYCSNECRFKARKKNDEIYYENDYAYILLIKNDATKKVLFDIDDIEKIKTYKWHLHLRKRDMRYDACTNTFGTHSKRKYITMPRFILNYSGNLTIDHLNHNTLDNRKCNLKIVSRYENNQNKCNNTSGCVGVCWDKNRNKWRVMFKTKNLGRFNSFEEAVKVRKQAENDYQSQNSVW